LTTYIQNFLRSVGIVTDTNMKFLSNYKALTSLESRKKTFEKFTKKLTHDVKTFCKAGLFYLGNFVIFIICMIKIYSQQYLQLKVKMIGCYVSAVTKV